LKAEDRAHRRGQTNAVNVYIFCAKVIRFLFVLQFRISACCDMPNVSYKLHLLVYSLCRIPWMNHIGKI